MSLKIVIRGGGDLASGVALRLYHSGLDVLIAELPEPLMVRRMVSFAEAVYSGSIQVEGVEGRLVRTIPEALECLHSRLIPVLVDPKAAIIKDLQRSSSSGDPIVVVDARMNKSTSENTFEPHALLIGLGPGFTAGQDCFAVVETNRGHMMGRVIKQGSAQPDTGLPEVKTSQGLKRVLRAPADGRMVAFAEIGDHLVPGQAIAEVAGLQIVSPFQGVLRGLLHPGLHVTKGLKLGDVDPRDDPQFCYLVSDKSLAVGGGVLEAILSYADIRPHLWS